MKRIAVIGASGFIGSHVMEQGKAMGHEMLGWDFYPEFTYADYPIDVRWPKDKVLAAIGPAAPDGIINLAGVLGTHELFDDFESAVDVNVKGQANVAWTAWQLGIPLVSIEQPHVWVNVYETTRGAGLRIARAFAEYKGLKFATVQAFNAFGTRQAHGDGHPQKIVPTFSVEAWQGRLAPIFGSGNQMTNLVHPRDIGILMIQALDIADETSPHLYGAAQGGNLTTNEVWQMVYGYANPELAERMNEAYVPMRDGESADGVGAPAPVHILVRQAQRYGVIIPQFTEADLTEAVEYYRDHPDTGPPLIR